MPSVTYSGSFGGNPGSNGLTATLTGSSVPSNAVITGVSYSLRISAGKYNSSEWWNLTQIAVGGDGGSPSATDDAAMSSTDHTFSGNMQFSASDIGKFSSNTITVYAEAYTTHSATSYLWDVSITVAYAYPDQNEPPSNVTINGSSSVVEMSSSTATLAWSGAKAGAYNSISGYYISVRDSTDGGATWELVDEDYEVTTSSTSGSVTVNLPAVGTRRKFRITTLSPLGTPYGSMDVAESPVVIRKTATTACGAPTACSVNSTLATGNVTLSWSGATAGTGNSITGYEVQRCESSNGSNWGAWESVGTTSATSLSVAPPSTAGNYYKFRVRTLGSAGSSYYSSWKESSNTLRRNWTACGAPLVCSVNTTLSTVNVTLSWSGATPGYGNAVTGYEVQRCESSNGSSWGAWAHLTTTTASSLSVAPPATAGNYYKYRVRTLGAAGSSYYSGWKESSNTLRCGHAALDGFTDETLTVGATYIKAIHMQELQNRVATLRSFYGLGAYGFTSIVAGQTSLAGWTAHVTEIRKAIDEIGVQHEAWLTISENKPRADVIMQLRRVVLSI